MGDDDTQSLADTLARARARLLEISPAQRDPRLAALLERLIQLGVELEGGSAGVERARKRAGNGE